MVKRAIGRRQNAGIDWYLLGTPETQYRSLLNYAEEFGLRFASHLGEFVEEDRAPVRAFEEALLPAVRAGESPLLVAEQLALDQRLRNRGVCNALILSQATL